jgi:hypothetical protein
MQIYKKNLKLEIKRLQKRFFFIERKKKPITTKFIF